MESIDSLPYIDTDISHAERDSANRLIQGQLAHGHGQEPHHSLRLLRQPKFSDLMQKEIARHKAGQPRTGGIDTSRYEAPDELSDTADVDEWKATLRATYISSTYLSGRRSNLALLEEYGKNAWLISNYELDGLLKRLEKELVKIKAQTDEVNKARKIAQEDSKGELSTLENTWRKGIGKIVEVQVATEQLRAELNQRRRNAAG